MIERRGRVSETDTGTAVPPRIAFATRDGAGCERDETKIVVAARSGGLHFPYMTQPTNASATDDPMRVALERAIGFQYEILRLLGRGGMGAVYHAHEKALDRPVAIKVLPPDTATGEARERFLREARTAARLTHPNIVPLFTFGEASGLIYFVMGYVEGESLEQRLRRAGPLDALTAGRMLEQVANALEYAHQQGIVHRDIKPDNILIDRATGDARLTDFGIAKRTTAGETLTSAGLLMGTPRYMSPEQASGERTLDGRSDVYSLGLVAYAMLTGRPPFDGESVQAILTQQVTREAPSLRKLLPDLATGTVSAVERALRKDPAQRWPTAGTMAAALRDDDDGVTASSASAMRRPGFYALANAVALVVGGNMVWWSAAAFRDPVFMWLFALLPLGFVADYLKMRFRDKSSALEIRRVFTEPPRWWGLWWPARWRRSDDVTPRLPRSVRILRNVTSAGMACAALALQGIFMALTWKGGITAVMPYLDAVVSAGLAIALPLLLGGVFGTMLVARALGISRDEAARLMSAPTGQARFWRQPWAAKLLSAPLGDVGHLEPQTPQALATAISGLVRQLSAVHREIGDGAEQAAQSMVAAVELLDSEAARLQRDIDPAEAERLETRLAALRSESTDDAPAQREMRALYTSQLDLLRRLARQAQELADRRARYVELLRTLWLQLATFRAEHAEAMRVEDVSDRIREIVQQVSRETDAVRAAESLVREAGRS